MDLVVVLANSGKGTTGALTINLTNVKGSGFSVLADGCTGKKLTGNKSCNLTVRYTRTSATTADSAQLLAASTKPLLNAIANFTGGLSEGCAAVNTPNFQGQYINGGVNWTFKAGETVTATAGDPTIGSPTQVIIFNDNANNAVDTAAYPGTAHYTIPTDGTYQIGWRTDTWQSGDTPTWTVSCG